MNPLIQSFILYLSTTKDSGGKEDVHYVSINYIKDLSNCGYRISEISQKTGADPKTIRKYLLQDDFPPDPPVTREKLSKLDSFKTAIHQWL